MLLGNATTVAKVGYFLAAHRGRLMVSDAQPLGTLPTPAFPILDIHELAAGKLAALLARRASRDLFDAHHLLLRGGLDQNRLRLAFVIYGGPEGHRAGWPE